MISVSITRNIPDRLTPVAARLKRAGVKLWEAVSSADVCSFVPAHEKCLWRRSVPLGKRATVPTHTERVTPREASYLSGAMIRASQHTQRWKVYFFQSVNVCV